MKTGLKRIHPPADIYFSVIFGNVDSSVLIIINDNKLGFVTISRD